MDEYDAHAIEEKWQAVWEDERAFHVDEPDAGRRRRARTSTCSRCCRTRPGSLHMGHVLNYTLGRRRHALPPAHTATRCCGRWASTRSACRPRTRRSRRAATRSRSPSATSRRSRSQMRRMGWAIDWQREVSAHEPTYYRWTQWLFLKFFEHGLAYRKEAPVNWCPNDQTVLANEHVVDGRCWRCGAVVEARNMAQWFFKITAYADALLDDLATIDWPERTKKIQTQLDRPLRRAPRCCSGSTSSTSTSRSSRRGPTRCSARRSSSSRPSRRSSTSWSRAPSGRRGARRTRASPRARPTEEREQREKTRRLHRPLRDEPGERRADPDLGRRLRADGVRHRRDHGRARRTTSATASSPRRTSCRSSR